MYNLGIIQAFAGMAQGSVTLLSIAQRNFKDILVEGELSEDRVIEAAINTLTAALTDNNASLVIKAWIIQTRAMQLFVQYPPYTYEFCMKTAREDVELFLSFNNLANLGLVVLNHKQQLADIWLPALEATQANIAEGFDESYLNGAIHCTLELLAAA
jgi:hypothetical protein